MTVLVHNDVLASGAKDKSCKGETSPHAVSVPWLSLCRGWGLGGGSCSGRCSFLELSILSVDVIYVFMLFM